MERFALQKLIEWKDSKRRKPLIVWGARQTGKTTLIRDLFAKNYYEKSYVYIDFKLEENICDFCLKTADPSKIMEYISLNKQMKINENTLLIFDEVQECPNLISALKYFCQDHREIPVIATGSMVRTKIIRETNKRGKGENGKFLFPIGKIDQMTLYPLTFEEYLFNSNQLLYETIKKAYAQRIPLDVSVHELAMDALYRYMLVGGMPEAVDAYIEDGDLLEAREILTNLYDNYLGDMQLYQASPEAVLRSRSLFGNIYRQLNRETKNFSPSEIEKNTKKRDFASSIQWLSLAHIIHTCQQLKEHVTMPLTAEEDSLFRIYLGDIGMFSYQSGINASSFVSSQRENTLSGIFFENYVANELVAKGIPLFYWKGKSNSEFEFIVESNNRLYPIDAKKGKSSLNSLRNFASHNTFDCAIKLSRNNYGYDEEKKQITIPLYDVSFLASDLKNGTFQHNTFQKI